MKFEHTFASLRVIESYEATRPPKGIPHCDDTREMIEHFQELGLIQRVPAAFQTPQGFIMHPAILVQVQKHCQDVSSKIKADMERKFLGLLR